MNTAKARAEVSGSLPEAGPQPPLPPEDENPFLDHQNEAEVLPPPRTHSISPESPLCLNCHILRCQCNIEAQPMQ